MRHDHESELDLLGWAERDQFVYYLTIAYMLTDPPTGPRYGVPSTAESSPPSQSARHRSAPTPTLLSSRPMSPPCANDVAPDSLRRDEVRDHADLFKRGCWSAMSQSA
jgi:hypothetical protein